MIKKDGSLELYQERKIRDGITRSITKRPIQSEQLNALIARISDKVFDNGDPIPSTTIGEWVMEELKEIDHVAFVRFASVYRRYDSVRAFIEEIDKI